jgi:hypothetical protein
MLIKQQMIPDEKSIPTRLFGIERQSNQVMRIAVLTDIFDYTPYCISAFLRLSLGCPLCSAQSRSSNRPNDIGSPNAVLTPYFQRAARERGSELRPYPTPPCAAPAQVHRASPHGPLRSGTAALNCSAPLIG